MAAAITIEVVETGDLGDRSYIAHDGTTAVVVDPQRDIDRVVARAGELRVQIAAVAETHIHNDYVTGGFQLAQETGADYLVNGEDPVAFERVAVHDGDERTYGGLRVRVVATPGHTHTHLAFVVDAVAGDESPAVFTGGSLLFGSVGRTDLLGEEHTDALTRAQFRTAHKLADTLPDDTGVYPTHGFGSFCSSGSASGGDSSTIGDQKQVNDALTETDEDAFVTRLVANLTAYPAYYAHMAPRNLEGPAPIDLSAPEPVDAAELRRRISAGEWVVDLRSRTVYPGGHLDGSVGIELGGQFSTYLGWLIPWGTPLTLLAESADDVAAAQRQLVRIGIDRPDGQAVGDIGDLAGSDGLASYPRVDFKELQRHFEGEHEGSVVLDVRRDDERAAGGVRGSAHVPMHGLLDRLDEVPEGRLWVHCAAGFRASIAASLLARAGRDVVLVDDAYDHAEELGLTSSDASQP
ncbi:MBL fold metallo-hydrolase [Nocardioides acrostichi]|uniref:MBL fold metallo-hydrolase n=1 Tax=Nocardioides acrostichi TaxID=2784339 RepID=A0A930Y559_9ACTN|nr:MBL fold metallo-hydrolase [Nocardioides acrostichi]MBF4160925.1 MBL fold metallo-hydrolase [Nocardioides acrostichi]